MKRMVFITVLIILSIAQKSFTQYVQEWEARYNSPQNGGDAPKALAIDDSGNVFVTGYGGYDGSNSEIVTIKYNTNGVQQWIAIMNGAGNRFDAGLSIVEDNSGNVYIAGIIYSGGATLSDYIIIKYNFSGIQQWVRTYSNFGYFGYDEAHCIAIDNSGGICVTGSSQGGGVDYDFATLKYNSAGGLLWTARYNGPVSGTDQTETLALDNFGNIFVTGYSGGNGTHLDYATVKYNSSGVQQWVARYDRPGGNYDIPNSVFADALSNVYVTGYSYDTTSFNHTTIKYNSSGTEQWVRSYPGYDVEDISNAVLVDNSGNVFVTGEFEDHYLTIKYSSSGDQLWTASYHGMGNESSIPHSMRLDSIGDVYVTGQSGAGGSLFDFATVKYNSTGNQVWVGRHNGSANNFDAAHSMVLDKYGNIYVSGPSVGIGSGDDYSTVKYSILTSNNHISNEPAAKYSMSQNYPNPFNPTTKINYLIPTTQYTILKIYGILGNEVATIVNEKQNAGSYSVEFDGANYPSGIYYYKLISGNFSDVRKMILLK